MANRLLNHRKAGSITTPPARGESGALPQCRTSRLWTIPQNVKRAHMIFRILVSLLTICVLASPAQARAQQSLVNYKSLAPGLALDRAQAARPD
jgi:hypothetical protein